MSHPRQIQGGQPIKKLGGDATKVQKTGQNKS